MYTMFARLRFAIPVGCAALAAASAAAPRVDLSYVSERKLHSVEDNTNTGDVPSALPYPPSLSTMPAHCDRLAQSSRPEPHRRER